MLAAIAPRLLDERGEEARVLAFLGARGRRPRSASRLERLDGAVLRPRRLAQAVADPAEALVVMGLHRRPVAEDAGRVRLGFTVVVVGEDAGGVLVVVVADDVRQVLDEIAAARHVQDLRAAADREHGQVPLERRAAARARSGRAAG